MSQTKTLLDKVLAFYRDYYKAEIGDLAKSYPRDSRSLYVQWSDLYQYDADFAQDIINSPHGGRSNHDPLQTMHNALYEVEKSPDRVLDTEEWPNAHVRIVLPQDKRMGLKDIRSRHKNTYVAIHGQIERVTQQTERVKKACFVCNKCNNEYEIIQPRDELQEPHSCTSSCSGKPNFHLDEEGSEMVDLRKLKLKQPPEESSGDGKKLTVYLEDDLAFVDGERTLPGMAGERATIHGILKRDKSKTKGRNTKPEFGSYLEGHAIEFANSVAQDIDTTKHLGRINEIANREDTLEYAIENFAPDIEGGDRIYHIKRASTLFLFGGYRKEKQNGSSERGDIHMLLVGDPATGKTSILDFIETVSPRCERLSGTDSTGVGLTAAAKQDEFADGDWVLKPGLLPRASGGHAIVDEIDKMDGSDNLHEALESQRIHVAKAGMKATLKTEVGLIAAGNPKDGEFTDWDQFIEQVDVDPALFSRFDVIHSLRDTPDAQEDEQIGEAVLDSWQQASDESEDENEIEPDVWRAWIAHAKDLKPELSDEAKGKILQFYREERDKGEDSVAITPRALPALARLAEAHARMKLRETVTVKDANVAIAVKKAMMGDIYLNEDLEADARRVTGITQQSRTERIIAYVRENEPVSLDEIQENVKGSNSKIEHDVNKLSNQNPAKLYEPENGKFRTV